MQAGLDQQDAHAWANYFQGAAQSNLLRKGHPVTVYKDSETGSVTGFKYDVDDRVQIYESSLGAGIIKAYRQPIRYTVRPVSLAFEVRGNSFQRHRAQAASSAVHSREPRRCVLEPL